MVCDKSLPSWVISHLVEYLLCAPSPVGRSDPTSVINAFRANLSLHLISNRDIVLGGDRGEETNKWKNKDIKRMRLSPSLFRVVLINQ